MPQRKTRFDRSRLLIGTYCIDTYARDEAHVRDMKNCGIDFLTAAPADHELLDNCKKFGMGVMATGILPGWWGGDGDRAGQFADNAPLEKIREAAEKLNADPFLKDHPALWGVDAGDEPSALDFPHYGKVIALAEELLPERMVYLNLYPNYASVAENTAGQVNSQLGTATYQEYIDRYVEHVKTDYICLDNYEFAAGTAKLYDNLRIVADACRKSGRDFWMVIQVNSNRPEKWLSADMLRHQAFSSMAHGAVSLNWACWTAGWWHNEVLDKQGVKTEQYEKLKKVNAEVRRLEPLYMKYRNIRTVFVGSAADDAIVASGTDHAASFSCLAFGAVKTGEGENVVLGEMESREGDSRAIFAADVTDPAFTSSGATRTLSFRAFPGWRYRTVGNVPVTVVREGDSVRILYPAYGAVMIAAEKE